MATKKIISHTTPFLRTILSPTATSSYRLLNHNRFLSSSELPNNDDDDDNNNNSSSKKVNTKLVNFSLPDSDSDEADEKPAAVQKPALPPPYDPFRKKPDPEGPKDLQEAFHKMRTEGLFDSAVKMFDGLSRDGLTHEALELFGRIKDRGEMPEVVAHTAVMEAYAEGGRPKEALRSFLRMLSCGVAPNAYTYSALVKGLAACPGSAGDAKKYLSEMVERGFRPNAGVCVAVVEAMVRDGKEEEGRGLAARLRERGFSPEEKGVREVLKGKRGPVVRAVMGILLDS